MATNNDWFEDAWRYRDAVLYPEQLGTGSTGTIITIPYVAFAQIGATQVDPRWLHCGVLVFPPTAERRNFTFLTSGLSNAWDDDEPDPASISGLGIELRIDTISTSIGPRMCCCAFLRCNCSLVLDGLQVRVFWGMATEYASVRRLSVKNPA